MSDGSDRQKSKPPQTAGYTMHPYYYQQYYMAQQMAGAGYVPVMATANGQYAYPVYAGMPQGAVPGAYYFPYSQQAYMAHYQQQYGYQQAAVPSNESAPATVKSSLSGSVEVTDSTLPDSAASGVPASPVDESDPPSPPSPSPPDQLPFPSRSMSRASDAGPISRTTSLYRTSSTEEVEPPLPLIRKVSKSFSVDKSKWRLSRSGSKPSLAIDGTGGEEGEDYELPSSPLLGRKQSLSVSPRHCGNPFLDEESAIPQVPKRVVQQKSFTKADIHLMDAIRMFSKEIEMPIDSKFAERLEMLENAAQMKMKVVMAADTTTTGEVIGLENPINSKICYLNSVVQILVPIAPLAQVFSLSLSHGSAGPWTTALARAMRLFFRPPMGVSPSLLQVGGMDLVVKELGGLGTQQDVAEALGMVLHKLHEEWKHTIRSEPWRAADCRRPTSQHGLEEDSVVYKLFRGVRCLGKQLEIFTQLHLAPPSGGCTKLVDLLAQPFNSELHYLPPVLCIELSRHLSENQLTTSQAPVSFSGSMRIPSVCCTPECNTDRNYELVGAVVRSGVYANSGHFWAAQRRGQKWFWINDTEVTECDVSQSEQSDMTEGLISKKLDATTSWCVLVYADPTAHIAIHPYN